jgi:PIN domain nuclease of toxin-antitoxin system
MILLLDTHVLLWAAHDPDRLPAKAREAITEPANVLWFSAATIWEVAIKATVGRADFEFDAGVLRRALVENGYVELPVTSRHAAEVSQLPEVHRDPFDRLLVAQARVEGCQLLTADRRLADYGSPVTLIV